MYHRSSIPTMVSLKSLNKNPGRARGTGRPPTFKGGDYVAVLFFENGTPKGRGVKLSTRGREACLL